MDDFFRLMFSFPSVQGILQWGFWDKVKTKGLCAWNQIRPEPLLTGPLEGERCPGKRGRLWSERCWSSLSRPLPQVMKTQSNAFPLEPICCHCREWNSSFELQPEADGSFTARWSCWSYLKLKAAKIWSKFWWYFQGIPWWLPGCAYEGRRGVGHSGSYLDSWTGHGSFHEPPLICKLTSNKLPSNQFGLTFFLMKDATKFIETKLNCSKSQFACLSILHAKKIYLSRLCLSLCFTSLFISFYNFSFFFVFFLGPRAWPRCHMS